MAVISHQVNIHDSRLTTIRPMAALINHAMYLIIWLENG